MTNINYLKIELKNRQYYEDYQSYDASHARSLNHYWASHYFGKLKNIFGTFRAIIQFDKSDTSYLRIFVWEIDYPRATCTISIRSEFANFTGNSLRVDFSFLDRGAWIDEALRCKIATSDYCALYCTNGKWDKLTKLIVCAEYTSRTLSPEQQKTFELEFESDNSPSIEEQAAIAPVIGAISSNSPIIEEQAATAPAIEEQAAIAPLVDENPSFETVKRYLLHFRTFHDLLRSGVMHNYLKNHMYYSYILHEALHHAEDQN